MSNVEFHGKCLCLLRILFCYVGKRYFIHFGWACRGSLIEQKSPVQSVDQFRRFKLLQVITLMRLRQLLSKPSVGTKQGFVIWMTLYGTPRRLQWVCCVTASCKCQQLCGSRHTKPAAKKARQRIDNECIRRKVDVCRPNQRNSNLRKTPEGESVFATRDWPVDTFRAEMSRTNWSTPLRI